MKPVAYFSMRMLLVLAVMMTTLAGVSRASDCIPGSLVVTGGGVVSLGTNVSLTLCLDQGETCPE